MIRKVTGIMLILAGISLIILLFLTHSPLFPHISGPIILIAIGIIILFLNRKKVK